MEKKPAEISSCEEAVFSLPDYMKDSRRFRIEYREPETGYSNVEGMIYLPNAPDIFDKLDLICQIIADSYGVPSG